MKKDRKPRALTSKELERIRAWLKEAWESGGTAPICSDFGDLFLLGTPNRRTYWRYAESETSSPTIATAATFISRMGRSLINQDSGDEEPIPAKVHKAIFEELRKLTALNDFEFFECVAIMLRHRREKKRPIAELDWRSIKKHAASLPKQPERMTLARAMEFAVFGVLRKRVGLKFLGDETTPACTTAVTRKELREALRQVQKTQGGHVPDRISEPQLSDLLNNTESGRFLVPLMHEQPIMIRKQKLQRTRNRTE